MAGERIPVLHCIWDGETGGAERAVYQLVRGQLESARVEPAIAFAQARGPYWEASRELGCEVIDLELAHGRAVRSLPRLTRLLAPHRLHHFHSAEPLLMASSLRCDGVRRVYTHRGGITDYPLRKRLQYRVAGAALGRFHAFSGNTRHAADCASRLFRVERSRFRTTYNGLDFTLLDAQRSATGVRKRIGIGTREIVIGTAANLREWKRIDRLLRLLAKLDRGQVRLLILGDGPDRPRLERLAVELGVDSRTLFAGVKRHVGDYLQVMDLFCLPSTGLESFGNAAVEAMAVGVPTIVFADGGGLTEHLTSGRTGFVVADEADLLSVVRRLIADEACRDRIGQAGRAEVRARYTMGRAIERYEDLYAEALHGHAVAPSDPGEGRA